MIEVQTRNPTKGDWVSTEGETETETEIQFENQYGRDSEHKTKYFEKFSKKNIEKSAFNDLIKKQKSGQQGQLLVFKD